MRFFSAAFALFLAMAVYPSTVFAAACSPGIPCTGYDVNTDTTAGTDAGMNGPKTGRAAPHTGGMCDGNFMNQIYAKAYMEASREVIINEQLIHKPDSVLEYTCFDQFIAQTAHNAGPIFSEADTFDNREVDLCTGDDSCGTNTTTYTVNYDDDHLDNVLDTLLLDTLEDYITNNFDHTFLGGESAIDNTLDYSAIGADSYDCSHMQAVWDIAKCRDFGEDDQFINFEDLSTQDPRILIEECSPGMTPGAGSNSPMPITENPRCPAAGGGPFATTNVTNDIIRVANNCDFLFAVYDGMILYFELLKAPNSTVGATTYTCSDPIPTGLTVMMRTHTIFDWNTVAGSPSAQNFITPADATHEDKFCPNPGCWYDYTADTCEPPPP